MFKSGDSLENTSMSPDLFCMMLYENVFGQDQDAFSQKRFIRRRRYDVRKFTVDTILFREIQSKRIAILVF